MGVLFEGHELMKEKYWDEIADICGDITDNILDLGQKHYSHNIISLKLSMLEETIKTELVGVDADKSFQIFIYEESPELEYLGWGHLYNRELYESAVDNPVSLDYGKDTSVMETIKQYNTIELKEEISKNYRHPEVVDAVLKLSALN